MRAQLLAAFVIGTGLIVLTGDEPPRARTLPDETSQDCTIADEEFWTPRAIDNSSCQAEGDGEEKDRAQNAAKNNLCAGGFLTSSPDEDPALVTQKSFKQLEAKAVGIRADLGIAEGTTPSASDRHLFEDPGYTSTEGDELGEGKLVRYVGFLLEGHYSGAEKVNCNRTTQANADIHLAFSEQKPSPSMTGAKAEALECGSITAEIIPRRRPEDWAFLVRMRKTGPVGLRKALEKIRNQDLHRPMRITGQLFFDGSHRVCVNGKKVATNQPPRVSNWEIHPVYAIDVCSFATKSRCRWDDETVWTPLHAWLEEEN